MSTTYGIDRGGSGDLLERELRTWLRGFDPGEMPADARVAITGDLSAAAAGGHARWLKPALAMTALAAAAALLLVLTVAVLAYPISSTGPIGGPSGPTGPVDPTSGLSGDEVYGPALDPIAVASLLGLCLLGGAAAMSARARRLVGRVLFGATPEASTELLPVRRRRLPRVTWALAAIAFVYIGFAAYVVVSPGAFFPLGQWTLILAIATIPALIAMCVAVPMRYSLAQTSSWFLIVGVATPLLYEELIWTNLWAGLNGPLFSFALTAAYCLGPCALAIGLGRRAGSAPAAPLRVGAVVVIAALALHLLPTASSIPWQPVEWIAFTTCMELLVVVRFMALVAGVWICIWTARRGGGVGWSLVAVALAATLLQTLPWRTMILIDTFVAGFFPLPEASMLSNAALESIMATANIVAMAAGLLLGLRRPPELPLADPEPDEVPA